MSSSDITCCSHSAVICHLHITTGNSLVSHLPLICFSLVYHLPITSSRHYATFCRRKKNERRTQLPQYDTGARESEELLRQDRHYQHLLRDGNTVDAEVTSHHEYGYVDMQPSAASITYDIGPPPSHSAPPPPPPPLPPLPPLHTVL